MEGSPLSSTSTFSDLDEGLEELSDEGLEELSDEGLDKLLNDSDMEIEDTRVNLNHLIKFHIRSDVFSFPAIWAEATRTLHKD